MTDQIIKFIDGSAPIIITAAAVYYPQWIASMKNRGGRWASAATVLAVIGHVVYRAYT